MLHVLLSRLFAIAAVLAVVQRLPGVSASFLHTGGTYNDTNSTCAYPREATPFSECPKGTPPFNLSETLPPNVNLSAGLIEFLGVDQQAFTFSATVQLYMLWLVDATTCNREPAKKCTKYCAKMSTGAALCCDSVWLPTINFINAVQKSAVEETFTIDCGAIAPDIGVMLYMTQVTATYSQSFDFTAYPFDQHALGVRLECADCRFDRLTAFTDVEDGLMGGNGWLWGQGVADDAASYVAISVVGDNLITGCSMRCRRSSLPSFLWCPPS